jgi:hypothetical protein
MAKRKSLLKKADVEVTQRARKCKHTRLPIGTGQTCLVVFEDSRQRFCYSRQIALQMIADARQVLNEMEAGLRASSPTLFESMA